MLQQSQRLRRELKNHDAAEPQPATGTDRRARGLSIRRSKQSLFATSAGNDNKDKDARCYIATPRRCGTTGFQSVRWAAAASVGAPRRCHLSRRLEDVARHVRRRGAGGPCGVARGITGPWQAQLQGSHSTALPNLSVNRTRYGRPPWPGWRYAVHFRQPGQGVLPPHAGYLER